MSNVNFKLRCWNSSDAKALSKHLNNIHIWNNCRDRLPFPYTENDAIDFIKYTSKQLIQSDYCIEVNSEAVGNIGFVCGEDVERYNAEVGYWISEDYWNKGITSDALKESIKHYFEHTSVIRLHASVFQFNQASMRVLEKAGFKKTCIHHKACFKNGVFIDIHYYELLKS